MASTSDNYKILTNSEYSEIIETHDKGKGVVLIEKIGKVEINLKYDYHNKRRLVYTTPFDVEHGAYCFLYAMVREFGYQDNNLVILRKGYERGWIPGPGKEFNNRFQGKYLHLIDFARLKIGRPLFSTKTYPPYRLTSSRIVPIVDWQFPKKQCA